MHNCTYSVGSVVLRSTITFSPFSFSDMYTLWGDDDGDDDDDDDGDDDDDDDDVHLVGRLLPPLLPSFELFPRAKISLSIPLEVFSPLGTTVEDIGEGWMNSF